MWSSRCFYPFPVFGSLLPVANGIRIIHTTFRDVTRFSTFFAGPLLKLKKGMRRSHFHNLSPLQISCLVSAMPLSGKHKARHETKF
jgi:hypothetical protein